MFRNVTAVLALALYCQNAQATDAEDGQRVHAAARELRDAVFDQCIAKFEVTASIDRNGATIGRQSGTLTFARKGSCVLSDTAISQTHQVSSRDGRPIRDSKVNVQFFMSNARRCIGIKYDQNKGDRKVTGVSCDPRRTYDQSFEALTKYVYLNHILAPFGPTGSSLVQLTAKTPSTIRKGQADSLTAGYRTLYGDLEVTLGKSLGRDVIVSVQMVQAANDVYTSLANGVRLGEIHESVLGKTPSGLSSVSTKLNLEYEVGAGPNPFSRMIILVAYVAPGTEWKSTHSLRLADYRKVTSEQQVEALKLPILEGDSVDSIDPSYQSIALVYRNGEVVREVDGATLEEVNTERLSGRSKVYGVLTVVTGVVLVSGAFYWYRRRLK